MRELDLEDSSEEDEAQDDDDEDIDEDSGDDKKKKQGSEDSFVSDEDFLNRSLQSDGESSVVNPINFLRYASGKENLKQDLLDIVDKNERSFK